MIISHSKLQIESKYSLFDIISQIIDKKKVKFREFISTFDFKDMSGQLWQNLCQCFFPHLTKKCQRKMNCQEQSYIFYMLCITLSCIIIYNYYIHKRFESYINLKNSTTRLEFRTEIKSYFPKFRRVGMKINYINSIFYYFFFQASK